MADDPGVMGNLPRSRPGRRSSKRDGGRASKPAETTPATEVTASSSGTSSSKPKASASSSKAKASSGSGKSAAGRSTSTRKGASTKPAGQRKRTAGSRTPTASRGTATPRARTSDRQPEPAQAAASSDRQESAGGTDPVTGAVLLAGKVVEGGMKVAGGILKRLPRP